MALIGGLAPVVTISLMDNNDNASSVKFFLPATVVTLAAALASANTLRDALVGLTNAVVQGASVAFPLSEDAPGAYVPESEVERKLIFAFEGANKRVKYSCQVPSPAFTLELPQTDVVDATTPEVLAFIQAVVANCVTMHGAALTNVVKAPYVDHR